MIWNKDKLDVSKKQKEHVLKQSISTILISIFSAIISTTLSTITKVLAISCHSHLKQKTKSLKMLPNCLMATVTTKFQKSVCKHSSTSQNFRLFLWFFFSFIYMKSLLRLSPLTSSQVTPNNYEFEQINMFQDMPNLICPDQLWSVLKNDNSAKEW